jgi:hypothetical protein
MREIFFILNARAGTNLWKCLAGKYKVDFQASKAMQEIRKGRSLINPDVEPPPVKSRGWTGGEGSFFLPTIPAKVCPCEAINHRPDLDLKLDYHAWWMPHGDWWGHATSNTVPGPYDLPCETRYGPDELRAYPGDWRFIYITRDGRNQIESLLNLPGGFEPERFKEDPKDYFEVVCKAWRNRARMALDNQAQMDNFKLFYFENFVADPVGTMSDMVEFAGFTPDREFIQRVYDLLTGRNMVKQHSSFGTLNNLNQRWHTWEKWQKETFHEIAGKELVDLGYEENNDW